MITHQLSSRRSFSGGTACLLVMLVLAFSSLPASAGEIPNGFTGRNAEVNGVKLHYLIGGKGSAAVVLHGYAQTSHMWNPILPELADNHTVIVPDLRGAGDSSKPESGYDKKSMAVDIHDLVTSLGIKRASVVGHDIGLMDEAPQQTIPALVTFIDGGK